MEKASCIGPNMVALLDLSYLFEAFWPVGPSLFLQRPMFSPHSERAPARTLVTEYVGEEDREAGKPRFETNLSRGTLRLWEISAGGRYDVGGLLDWRRRIDSWPRLGFRATRYERQMRLSCGFRRVTVVEPLGRCPTSTYTHSSPTESPVVAIYTCQGPEMRGCCSSSYEREREGSEGLGRREASEAVFGRPC